MNQSAHAVHLKSAQLPHQSVLPFDGNLGSTPTVTRPRGAGEATPTKHCLVASSDTLSMAINDGETCKSRLVYTLMLLSAIANYTVMDSLIYNCV